MWTVEPPQPVKLICGMLGPDESMLDAASTALCAEFGPADLVSPTWPFTQTDYYNAQIGERILRRFISFSELIDPGRLAGVKHWTNRLEQEFAGRPDTEHPRPLNLDPGYLEPGKLVLASTKNYSHRIYIGENLYAEVTLTYAGGGWQSFAFTFPDFCEPRYHGFLSDVRGRLVQQRRELNRNRTAHRNNA